MWTSKSPPFIQWIIHKPLFASPPSSSAIPSCDLKSSKWFYIFFFTFIRVASSSSIFFDRSQLRGRGSWWGRRWGGVCGRGQMTLMALAASGPPATRTESWLVDDPRRTSHGQRWRQRDEACNLLAAFWPQHKGYYILRDGLPVHSRSSPAIMTKYRGSR